MVEDVTLHCLSYRIRMNHDKKEGTMKYCIAKVLSAAVLAAAFLSHGAVNIPLGTYIYAGSVMDFRNAVQGAESGLTIYAVSTNGTVLSSCALVDADESGCNFRLEVPVSTFATDKSAAVGDAPNCFIESASGMRSAATTSFPPILCASAVTNCIVKYANAREYDYKGERVLVPEDYIDGISFWMNAHGHSEYSAEDDWDGDGRTNYEEYVAGTNPFDPSDYLRVTAFSVTPSAHVLTFEYVGGHLYALQSAENLSNPKGVQTRFSSESGATRTTAVYEGPGDEDVGEATLYVTPVADTPQKFYRMEVK